jgi:hypothetical protein
MDVPGESFHPAAYSLNELTDYRETPRSAARWRRTIRSKTGAIEREHGAAEAGSIDFDREGSHNPALAVVETSGPWRTGSVLGINGARR